MQLTEREKQRLDKNICRPYGANILNLAMEAEMTKAHDFCRKIDACREDINWLNVSLQCCCEDDIQGIKDMIRQDRAMIRFWTFCKNVFRCRKRRMSRLLARGYASQDRLGDISELFAGCPDGKGKRRAYEITDIVEAYVKHVAEEEQIPYAYVRIRQDAGTGELDVQYGEARLVFDDIQYSGSGRKTTSFCSAASGSTDVTVRRTRAFSTAPRRPRSTMPVSTSPGPTPSFSAVDALRQTPLSVRCASVSVCAYTACGTAAP